jgi:hypothetical protein
MVSNFDPWPILDNFEWTGIRETGWEPKSTEDSKKEKIGDEFPTGITLMLL